MVKHMFSFIDGLNGYNQIKLHPYGANKITFKTYDKFLLLCHIFGLIA